MLTILIDAWIAVRLSLLPVQTFAARGFPFGDYWGFARGRYWRLLLSYLLVVLEVLAFLAVSFVVVVAALCALAEAATSLAGPDPGPARRPLGARRVVAVLPPSSAVVPLTLICGCQAYAYRAIVAERAAPPARLRRHEDIHRSRRRRRTSTPATAPPDMIVLHYTGMQTGEAALARLRDPAAKVSAHYLVEEDGRVFALVPEERRAWHAGKSFWKGESDINGRSIGVEIVNPGHEFGYRAVPGRPDRRGDRAGGRHPQPLERRRRAASSATPTSRRTARRIRASCSPGSGWPRPATASGPSRAPAPGAPLAEGDEGTGVFALQAGLTRLGYDSAPSGTYDAATAAIVTRLPAPLAPAPGRRRRRRRDPRPADRAA